MFEQIMEFITPFQEGFLKHRPDSFSLRQRLEGFNVAAIVILHLVLAALRYAANEAIDLWAV